MELHLPIKLPLGEDLLRKIVEDAKDWGLMHGVAIRPTDNADPNSLAIAPHCLLPSPIPRADFDELTRIQPALNLLMHKVAHDHAFLEETLKSAIQYDDFTRKAYEVYEAVRNEGFTQDVSLGLCRSDYLPDSARSRYQQVEFNTVATSLSSLSTRVKELQSYIMSELGHADLLKNMPDNDALNLMCLGIVRAWEHYGNDNAIVIFLVEDVTFNICDQRFMEYQLKIIQPKIKVRRVKFSEHSCFSLSSGKELIVNGEEVAVAYYRTAYSPNQYGEKGWETRLLIERSKAIKCPSIQYHLAGTKKVQQQLALPNVVERFVSDPDEAKAIRRLFAELHPLDFNEEGNKAYDLAMEHPEKYVLKPQREGGGNNVYKDEIPGFLKALGKERPAYILMGLISPTPTKNYALSRSNGPTPPLVSVVSEFGVYGVILGSPSNILANYQAGHMLRSKLDGSNEGGVAVGSGFLDSPYLV
ncbi:Glutathione [Nesidiocoris tenuis]|uniref:Glutathione synthetase n=1 Tax=Nesidiocoris tenuis TaxID=355587 RepID=A0ABN7AHD6_9HEMI|nr:Glutathione [Nesidiocoris tenuis]